MPKTLVTDGNIGRYVAEGLAKRGVPVRVLVRAVQANQVWDELGIEQVAGDMASVGSLRPAFDGVDRFFSVTPYVENLVELGTNVVEAARRAGVNYIVRSSLMGASESSITLRRWHRSVEKAIEASGIPWTIIQPNTFMQSTLMNAASIKATNAFYAPQGDGKVSVVDVRDIAAVAVVCLTESGHKGRKYVVTGGESLSNTDIAKQLSDVLGRKISYYDVTPEQAEQSMTQAGLPTWMVQSLLELFSVSKAGDVAAVSPVVDQLLKRKPITFVQFVKENADAFCPEKGVAA